MYFIKCGTLNQYNFAIMLCTRNAVITTAVTIITTALNIEVMCDNFNVISECLYVQCFARMEWTRAFFKAHGSLHRNSILINIQPDATVCRYLFTVKLLYMFRVSQHTSSAVLKTVTAACGTGHIIGKATSLQHGLIGSRWREIAAPVLWPVPEAAVTVFSTPDDGFCDTRNM